MSTHTVKRIDDMEGIFLGGFKLARAELGVEAFGMQVLDIPPNYGDYPEHDHAEDGQEEVYVTLRGGGELEIEAFADRRSHEGQLSRGSVQTAEALKHGLVHRRRQRDIADPSEMPRVVGAPQLTALGEGPEHLLEEQGIPRGASLQDLTRLGGQSCTGTEEEPQRATDLGRGQPPQHEIRSSIDRDFPECSAKRRS